MLNRNHDRLNRFRSALAAFLMLPCVGMAGEFITLASTTTADNSGLLEYLLPMVKKKLGFDVRAVITGTGQAIKTGERGDADVLLVHHQESEEAFVAGGFGVKRHQIMYNDFVVVGPKSDPARVYGSANAALALSKVAEARAPFTSRGDDSGTHKKELMLWNLASIDVAHSVGAWYRETGAGMGSTLNTAANINAYAVTDRGTWISFGNKRELTVLNEGDPLMVNPYSVILVNPSRHPHIKQEKGQAFIDWLLSDEGQEAIAAFEIDEEQLFIPAAERE